MSRVGIVDYGVCNLDSVVRAVEECGGAPVIVRQPRDLDDVAAIVLPGVGTFSQGMRNLRGRRLDEALQEQVVGNEIPLLGLCLGMQLLGTAGAEGGADCGLGWIDGEVVRLEPRGGERVPHVGWNEVQAVDDSPLFRGIEPGRDFYFVHSYHLACHDQAAVAALTPAYGGFAAAVAREHVMGVQFHPEKSQRVGFQLLKNFLRM